MKSCPSTYYVTVIEDTETGKIIGAATLFVEMKFIRNCATVKKTLSSILFAYETSKAVSIFLQKGVIEDVVVSDQYRGKQLGKM